MSTLPDPLNTESQERLLSICLSEYDKLKTEQIQRIGFRDNLLYVTLGLFGAVFSYAVSDPENHDALLVLPWVCFVLGWTYLMNDEKISSIGNYFRDNLEPKIKRLVGTVDIELLGWEYTNLKAGERNTRKLFQLFVNAMTFCFSGFVALAIYWVKASPEAWLEQGLVVVGTLLLIILGIWFLVYAGFTE